MVCLVINLSSSSRRNLPVNSSLQIFGMILISFGIFLTYLFTLIRVIAIVVKNAQNWIRAKRGAERGVGKAEGGEELRRAGHRLIFYKKMFERLPEPADEEIDEILNEPFEKDSKKLQKNILKKNSLPKIINKISREQAPTPQPEVLDPESRNLGQACSKKRGSIFGSYREKFGRKKKIGPLNLRMKQRVVAKGALEADLDQSQEIALNFEDSDQAKNELKLNGGEGGCESELGGGRRQKRRVLLPKYL